MSVRPPVSFAVTGQNQFSNTILVENGGASVYADGSLTGKITLQGRPAGTGGAFTDLANFTNTPGAVATAVMPGAWEFRAGCKTGDYTSGSTTTAILQASNQEGGG